MPPTTKPSNAALYAWTGAVALALAFSFVHISAMDLNVDETFHYPQIMRFLGGDFRLTGSISMLPGYHYAVFLIARAVGADSVIAIRLISFCFSLVSIGTYYLAARQLRGEDAASKTFQYTFFPLLYPFFFVIYTDVTSVLLVVLGIFLTLKRRYLIAGLVGIISCFVRQDNVIWVGFMFLVMASCAWRDWNARSAHDHRRGMFDAGLVGTIAANGVTYLLAFILFVAFVVVNGRVAVDQVGIEPAFALYPGNVWFLLFAFFFLFLPRNIANAASIGRLLRRHRLAVVYIAAFFALFMATFKVDHPYNIQPWAQWFLSNRILAFSQQSALHKVLFFLPVLYSVLSLLCTKLYAREYYLIYPLSVVFLMPHWNVDPRYHLLPLLLFLLFKEGDSRAVTRITGLMYVALSAYFFESIATYEYFF
jgi:alpha-1,2-glucosyltransferase